MVAKLTQAEAARLGLSKVRPHKYRAVRCEVDGITFASKREAQRWGELKLLEKAGEILHLRRQVKWDLTVRGVIIESYRSDFQYFLPKPFSMLVVEDAKGYRTRDFLRKRKWMKAVHGITIQET